MKKTTDKVLQKYIELEEDINKRFPVSSNKRTNEINAGKIKKELIIEDQKKDREEFLIDIWTGLLIPFALFCYSTIYSCLASSDKDGLLMWVLVVIVAILVLVCSRMLLIKKDRIRNLSLTIEILQQRRAELLLKS